MLKKLLTLALTLSMTAGAIAEEVEINGLWYDVVSRVKEAKVIKYKNNIKYCDNVVIPATVEYDGIEYSVTSIGDNAFENCSGLTFITIPSSVMSIGKGVFSGCSGLISVIIPNSVTSIGDNAFENCSGLTFITIPGSVTRIGDNAFSRCTSLTSITIPESVKAIGGFMFYGCSSLTSITIPSSVISIGFYAFYGCSGLTSISIPNTVSNIGSYAFARCSGLTSVTIPGSVTSIEEAMFYLCKGLTSITIPSSVTSIGNSAFSGCSGLTSVTIPNSVTNIGESTFKDCSSLTSIPIPNSVISIGESAFLGCTELTSITIPGNVTSIGNGAFTNCTGLTSVTIPGSVTNIRQGVFLGCSGLTSVTIGSGIRTIGTQAFAKCTELADVYCLAEKVPSTGTDAFADSYINYSTLHVPASAINSYRARVPWSGFGTIVALDGEEPEVKQCATPTISYADGKLSFDSATEGVEFISKITSEDINSFYTSEIDLTATYTITVYATKTGYENSETATATLCWMEETPGEDTAIGVIQVPSRALLIQQQGSVLTVQGAADGTLVSVYGVNGILAGSSVAQSGLATISHNLPAGSVAIIKVGNQTVKVLVQ